MISSYYRSVNWSERASSLRSLDYYEYFLCDGDDQNVGRSRTVNCKDYVTFVLEQLDRRPPSEGPPRSAIAIANLTS